MYKRIFAGVTIAAASLIAVNAHALTFGKPISTAVPLSTSHLNAQTPAYKQVTILTVTLTAEEQALLFNYHPKPSLLAKAANLPAHVSLGMNGVPVLDQGMHGTCATFANTAVVNAVLNKGDMISQLCQLELGAYLEDQGSYMPSGWNGSYGPFVLDQMRRFGVVTKAVQEEKSCATVKEYPLTDYTNEGQAMPLSEYAEKSIDVSNKFYYLQMMDFSQRFMKQFNDTDSAEKVLQQTKKALNRGNRLSFGTFLVISEYCPAGACASFHAKHDTWALTKELELPPYTTGGHEMVITGYDDNAVAYDNQGIAHKGLLTLRNSWGADVGDHGDFYMSYDYFKKFVGEVQEIGSLDTPDMEG